MKLSLSLFVSGWACVVASSLHAADTANAGRHANTVVLDAVGVTNLRIQTVQVEPGDFENTIFALGRIEAKPGNTAVVASTIPGRVVAIGALPGDAVAAGEVVAKIESRQPGNPPPSISLKAPLGGIVTRHDLRLGDPVEPDRVLVEITDLHEVVAIARVPEHTVGSLVKGTTAHIRISAVPEATFEGQLIRFGTSADSASGTLDAVFVLANPDRRIRPGMRAEFSLVVSKRSDVLSVPRSALQGEPSHRFLYVKDFDLPHAFVKTNVVTGEVNDGFVEILSGLLPADEVVTQGAYSLAFAGRGSVSLKEALDAAHGHEHAADGSELKPGQKGSTTASSDHHDHGHDDHPAELMTSVWPIISGVLFVLLVIVSFKRRVVPEKSDSDLATSSDSKGH